MTISVLSITTEMKTFQNIWIGLVHIIPREGNDALGAAVGAYAQIVGMVETESQFIQVMEHLLDEYEFELVSFEEVESLAMQCDGAELSAELTEAIKQLNADRPVVFGPLHAYDMPELNETPTRH